MFYRPLYSPPNKKCFFYFLWSGLDRKKNQNIRGNLNFVQKSTRSKPDFKNE